MQVRGKFTIKDKDIEDIRVMSGYVLGAVRGLYQPSPDKSAELIVFVVRGEALPGNQA